MNLRVSVAPFSTGVDETREQMEDEHTLQMQRGGYVGSVEARVCVCVFLGVRTCVCREWWETAKKLLLTSKNRRAWE